VAVVAGTVSAPPGLAAEVESASAAGGSGSGAGGRSVRDGFASCAAAKAAGRGTIVKTDPAYRAWLDTDGDGLACEKGEGLGGSLASTGSTSGPGLSLSLMLFAAGVGFVALARVRRRTAGAADVSAEV
jgi:hypothetical protein